MTQDNSKIQQSANYATIVGELLEMKLEPISNGKYHKLEMKIEAGDNNIIKCEKFSPTVDDKNQETGQMKAIRTIMSEYIAKNDEKNETGKGTMIKAISNAGQKYKKANLDFDEYFGQQGEGDLIRNIKLVGFSPNRVYDNEEIEPMASFVIEGMITDITPKLEGGEPKGEVDVEIATFNYKGELVPFTVTFENTEESNLADQFPNYYMVGQTVEFFGNIVNEAVTEEVTEEVGFGAQKQEIVTSYKRGLYAIGALPAKSDGTEYTQEQYEIALSEREARLEASRQKQIENAKKKGTGKPNGFGGANRPNPANYGGGFAPDTDDIPF